MPSAAQTVTPTDDKPLLDDKGAFSQKEPTGTTEPRDKPAADAKVRVQIGNEFIETDAASAAALNQLMGMNQQLADQIRKTIPADKPAAKKADGYDYSVGLFTEPEVAIAKLRAEIKAEVMGEVTTAYNGAETQKQFWKSFYTENADLKEDKFVVDAVLARDWSKLQNLPTAEAGKKLAESVKKELMRLKGGKSDSDPSRSLEGSSNRNTAPSDNKGGDDKVLSLSEIVRKRQEARRKATFSKE